MKKDKEIKDPIIERLEIQFREVDALKEALLDETLSEQEKLDKIEAFEDNLGFMQKFMRRIDEERKKPSFVHKKPNG
jgi:hypothetical protein